MGKLNKTVIYQYMFTIKMLIKSGAEVILEKPKKLKKTFNIIPIKQITAIRGVKKFKNVDSFEKRYGDIISIFRNANCSVFLDGKIYQLPTLLCMEIPDGNVYSDFEIISEGKLFYEQIIDYFSTHEDNYHNLKLIKNNDIISFVTN